MSRKISNRESKEDAFVWLDRKYKCALKFCYVSLDSHMLRTSGYEQNCTIGLQWHLMGTYHYSYYNPETSDGKFSQVECLYLLIQYLFIKSKMHTEFFSKLSIFILPNLSFFSLSTFKQIQLLHSIIIIMMKGNNNLHSHGRFCMPKYERTILLEWQRNCFSFIFHHLTAKLV